MLGGAMYAQCRLVNAADALVLPNGVTPADGASFSTLKISGTREQPVVTAAIPPNLMRGVAARVDQSLPVGNEGAGICFVNPLTSLGMTETMRREGHTALVHTAAASNLGSRGGAYRFSG
jgi:hypothetical protein